MSHDVPSVTTLESLRKEAKRWLQALRRNDDGARARLERAMSPAPHRPTLRDVQHALARERGFAGWPTLKQAAERASADIGDARARTLGHYEAAAAALLDAYRTGTPEALERHYRYTWHRRAWQAMRTYVQLDLGKRPAYEGDTVEITLDDARRHVAVEHGFADWTELEAFAKSVRPESRIIAKPVRLVFRRSADDWQLAAGSRRWEEVLELLAAHPEAGLSGQGQLTDDLLAELSRVATLTTLGLSGCREVTDEGIGHLARLPLLEHLDLSGTRITDAGLEVLRQLPRLRTVRVASNDITERGIGVLSSCAGLESVAVWGTPELGDAAIRSLAGKRRLRHLEMAVTDAGLALLRELPVFKEWQGGEATLSMLGHRSLPNHLFLRGTFTDRGMRDLRMLDGLFSLDIDDRGLAITAAALEPLVSLPHLGALSVDAKDDWMPWIARMPHVRYLGIQDTTAGDDGFVALSDSASVEYIWGRRCHNLGTRGFLALAKMPSLRGLSVSCLNVGDEGIAALPAFPALRELMPMDVPDAGYRHIGRCQALESLLLMYCRDTTDAATEQVTGLSRLSCYFNSYTRITDRTPELLSTIDSLERITFETCHGLTDAGVARLCRLPRLRELRASGHGLTPALQSVFPPAVSVFYERS